MKTKKQIIEEYAQKIGLVFDSNAYLAEDCKCGNWLALRFPAYAIQNLPHMQNLKECFLELADITKDGNDSRSRYYNQLTEFHAVWFVSCILKLNVVAMEHRICPIRSPNCQNDCSCDILAKTKRRHFYFEVKDLSSETLSEYEDNSISQDCVFFDPSLPSPRQHQWINRMLWKSVRKGANYLICRIPVWSPCGVRGFGTRWLHEIFGNVQRLGCREYALPAKSKVPAFFKGVYLIHNRRYLFLKSARNGNK